MLEQLEKERQDREQEFERKQAELNGKISELN